MYLKASIEVFLDTKVNIKNGSKNCLLSNFIFDLKFLRQF